MVNSTEVGKNTIINNMVNNYVSKARQEDVEFNYNIISPPLLSMNDDDLTNMLNEVLNAMFKHKSNGVFLNVNVFSGKMQIECKSFQLSAPEFNKEEVETILSRNDGMLKSKFCNNEFTVQIVFPV